MYRGYGSCWPSPYMRQGMGLNTVMEKVAAAVAGVYTPKGFEQHDMDIALLAF